MVGTAIDVREATVRTATVEIRTLAVSGKQVTLAVFRQLVIKYPLDDEGALRGTPWGWVNYYPDKDGDDYLHVVWQDGDRLVRGKLYQPKRRAPDEFDEQAEALVCALALEGRLTLKDEGNRTTVLVRRMGHEARIKPSGSAMSLVFGWYTNSYRNYGDRELSDDARQQKARDAVAAQMASLLCGGMTSAAIEEEMCESIALEDQRYDARQASYRTCQEAGQLFIAV